MCLDSGKNNRARLLDPYGEVLAYYEGQGTLSSDRHSAACHFAGGQLRNGNVFLLCDFAVPVQGLPFALADSPVTFSGTTDDNLTISACARTQSNWLPETPRRDSMCLVAYIADQLTVTSPACAAEGGLIFDVTNFNFPRPFTCPIISGGRHVRFEVNPINDAQGRLKRLETVGGTDVTTRVVVGDLFGLSHELWKEIVDDFCHVASVALGTHVQWVSLRHVDPELGHQTVEHHNRFTRRYCPLSVIDHRAASRAELPDFISSCLMQYRIRKVKWALDRGPIAAYLDAKSEGDLLESRAIKISVAIEHLKAAYLESEVDKVKEHIVDEAEYERYLPRMEAACQNVLRDNVSSADVKEACSQDKLRGLNRRSFRYLLKKLLEHLEFSPSKQDLDRFIKCRNNLIHTGRFASDEPVDEWLFLVNMLDRLYLKLLGYSGPYINWTKPVNERRDILK